jgi:hypothetical protein
MGECKRSHSGDRKTFPAFRNAKGLLPRPEVEHLVGNRKVEGRAQPVLNYFSGIPSENSGGAENAAENSGTNGKNFFAICTN